MHKKASALAKGGRRVQNRLMLKTESYNQIIPHGAKTYQPCLPLNFEMQIPKNDPVRLLRQSCTAPFCWGTCLSRTVSRTRLTAMRFHAILCYSEGRNSRENAMSFRFFPWTKVSLILQGLRTFSADFGDKKIPRGCGDLPKRAIRLENPLLGSAVPRAVRDGIACNPYRLRY